mgnify:CR=1 FL=1
MDPNWAPFVSLAIQVPLVGVFIWFTLQLQKRHDDSQALRDKDWREFVKQQRDDHLLHEAAMQEKWREFLEKETRGNKEFLDREAKENKEVMDRLTREIETMSTNLTSSNSLIMAHDMTTRELLSGMRASQKE